MMHFEGTTIWTIFKSQHGQKWGCLKQRQEYLKAVNHENASRLNTALHRGMNPSICNRWLMVKLPLLMKVYIQIFQYGLGCECGR